MNLPIGRAVPGWTSRAAPTRAAMMGRYCRLEAIRVDHAEALHDANRLADHDRNWTYLPYGPFPDLASYRRWIAEMEGSDDPLMFVILDHEERPVGVAGYLRVAPAIGSIEVGHINYSPLLQRRREATEAMYLMMFRAFEELRYRRYEWKCDALNAGSRRAADRLGFLYEGTFRQAMIYKGRNRDTAWYSIIDSEWPRIRARLEAWLHPANFDEHGAQRTKLVTR